jgi:hypothetical protein
LDTEIYLLYNTHKVFLLIGKDCDPFFSHQLFGVTRTEQIPLPVLPEAELFSSERVQANPYLEHLYGLIN